MKKLIFFVILILIVFFGVRFLLGGAEDTWICEDGEWVAHGNPSTPQPIEDCPKEQGGSTSALLNALNKAKELNKNSNTLDVSNQNLTSLTTEFFNDHPQVRFLNVSHNNLTGALPAEIRRMTNLEELDASYNNLTGIPAEIGQLNKIKKINFSHNNINTIPNELINLADTLEEFNVTNNGYSAEQLEGLQVMLPNTEIVY